MSRVLSLSVLFERS